MELTNGDKISPLWVKLYGFLDARLETVRLRLEHSTSHEESQLIRGQISELRWLMRLNDDVPIVDE